MRNLKMKFGPRKIEENIIAISNMDMMIYRIFSYERFEQLIKSKELVLVNPSKWDDPFENFFLKTEVDCGNNEIATLESIACSWYGQCWTTNSDTDAMWRIYSAKKDGIRVKTSVRKLFSSVFNTNDSKAGLKYFIGAVEYKDKSDIISFMEATSFMQIASGGQNDNFAKLLCIKRNEFMHESEIRILVNDVDNQGEDGYYKISFDPHSTLDEICIDPRANDKDFMSLFKKITDLGVNLPIIQSDLYKVKLPRIRL